MNRMKWGAVLWLSAALSGCPEQSPGPAKVCTKLYEQCKLPGGTIGVCSEAPCQDPAEGGCLRCQDQH